MSLQCVGSDALRTKLFVGGPVSRGMRVDEKGNDLDARRPYMLTRSVVSVSIQLLLRRR